MMMNNHRRMTAVTIMIMHMFYYTPFVITMIGMISVTLVVMVTVVFSFALFVFSNTVIRMAVISSLASGLCDRINSYTGDSHGYYQCIDCISLLHNLRG